MSRNTGEEPKQVSLRGVRLGIEDARAVLERLKVPRELRSEWLFVIPGSWLRQGH